MLLLLFLLLALVPVRAQSGQNVLVVVNRASQESRQVADYYRVRRSVPSANVCGVSASTDDEITWDLYQRQIERPIEHCLEQNGMKARILYIVLTMGLPLKVAGAGMGHEAEYASVDSELTLLYAKMAGANYTVRAGPVANPFFMQRDAPFRHPRFPIYLVTRLAAYDVKDVKAMIDRSLAARNRGRFVIDAGPGNADGNVWLRTAAMLLPKDRVILDATPAMLYDKQDVIGYYCMANEHMHPVWKALAFRQYGRGDSLKKLTDAYPPLRVEEYPPYKLLWYSDYMSFNALVVLAKDDMLASASAEGCTWGHLFFGMSPAEEAAHSLARDRYRRDEFITLESRQILKAMHDGRKVFIAEVGAREYDSLRPFAVKVLEPLSGPVRAGEGTSARPKRKSTSSMAPMLKFFQ